MQISRDPKFPNYYNNEKINLLEQLYVLRKNWGIIFFAVIFSISVATINNLNRPFMYEAKAVIMPHAEKIEIQSMFELQTSSGADYMTTIKGISVYELDQLLVSKGIREQLIIKYNLLPVLFRQDWNRQANSWKSKDNHPNLWDGIRELEEVVTVDLNPKDKTITLTAKHDDPIVAAALINQLLDTLNEHITNEIKAVSKINKGYLEAQIEKNADPLIRQKIYELIVRQIGREMMASAKENFAFRIIDPPRLPNSPMNWSLWKTILFSFIASLFLGIPLAFFREYLNKLKLNSSV